MRMSKHTPLPWKADDHDRGGIRGPDGMPIVDTDYYGEEGTEDQPRLNAEFIVRACNSHYELVEALEAHLKKVPIDQLCEYADELEAKTIAALARAKGEQQ